MWEDPIVEEIRRGRLAHAESFNFDVAAIYADIKATEKALGRKVVKLEPRPAVVYPALKDDPASSLNVPGIDTDVSTQDILEAIRESRDTYQTEPPEETESE